MSKEVIHGFSIKRTNSSVEIDRKTKINKSSKEEQTITANSRQLKGVSSRKKMGERPKSTTRSRE